MVISHFIMYQLMKSKVFTVIHFFFCKILKLHCELYRHKEEGETEERKRVWCKSGRLESEL